MKDKLKRKERRLSNLRITAFILLFGMFTLYISMKYPNFAQKEILHLQDGKKVIERISMSNDSLINRNTILQREFNRVKKENDSLIKIVHNQRRTIHEYVRLGRR